MIIYDGQFYENEADVPNLGSIVCIDLDDTKRIYRGLSVDASKLPKYDNLESGSSCLMLDTGDYYEYMASKKQWYKL